MEHHLAGRSAEAEGLYRDLLAAEPENADALHRLGVLAMQKGDWSSAIDLIGRAAGARPESANIHASLGQALERGRVRWDAIATFERALAIRGDLAEALFGLGIALQNVGDRERAVEVYQQLLTINPDFAEGHNNLGNALFGLGRIKEAAREYRRAMEIQPDRVETIGNLGSALGALGRMDEAIEMFRRGLQVQPDSAVICNNLGNALLARKRFDEAQIVLRRALELKPDFAAAAYNLGNALAGRGEYPEAVEMFRRAVRLDPNYIDAFNNLGNALQGVRDYKGAAEAYLAALKIRPDFVVGYNNLGNALRTMGKTDDAIAALEQAIRLRPDYHAAHCNLGNAMKDAGKLDEAMKCYRRAVELQPRDSISHSNLCFTMLYHPDCDSEMILREALRWNVLHAQPVKSEIRPHDNDRTVNRRLRIGYVAADFREHCQSMFTVPLLSNHDREQFEVFCYAHVSRPDATTERIRGCADVWRSILGMSDQEAAKQIRQDRIDILVDLTMHMAHGRPLVFAQARSGAGGVAGVSGDDGRGRDRLPIHRSLARSTRRGSLLFRKVDPAARNILVLRFALQRPGRQPVAGVDQWLYHLRLPEQFLQSDRPDAPALGRDFAVIGKFPADFVGPAGGPSNPRAEILRGSRHRSGTDRIRRISTPAGLSGNLSQDRHRFGYAAVQRAHDESGFVLDGRSGRDAHRLNRRRPGGMEPVVQFRAQGVGGGKR